MKDIDFKNGAVTKEELDDACVRIITRCSCTLAMVRESYENDYDLMCSETDWFFNVQKIREVVSIIFGFESVLYQEIEQLIVDHNEAMKELKSGASHG